MIDHDHLIDFNDAAYKLRAASNSEELTPAEIDAAGTVLWELSQQGDETALSWHLAADAARMKALARQDRVLASHVQSVIAAALRRIDREVSWVT